MSGVCEYCQTGFSCGRLYAAMRIVEAHPEYLQDTQVANTLAVLKGRLTAANWNYPDTVTPCRLVGKDADIGRLTAQLIRALRERQIGDEGGSP